MNRLHLTSECLADLRACHEADHPFNLSDECRAALLEHHNIKLQRVQDGYVCFQHHDVGSGSRASTSGEAFALFLRRRGMKLQDLTSIEAIESFI